MTINKDHIRLEWLKFKAFILRKLSEFTKLINEATQEAADDAWKGYLIEMIDQVAKEYPEIREGV